MFRNKPGIFTILMLILTSWQLEAQSIDQYAHRLKKRGDFGSLRQKFEKIGSSHNVYIPAPAKRNCGMQKIDSLLRLQYPDLETEESFEDQMSELIKIARSTGMDRGQQNIITIPVVVHVVHNGEGVGSGSNISLAQIQSQIDVLNEDFRRLGSGSNNHPAGADTEIQFALARVNPDGAVMNEPGANRVNGGRASWEFDAIQNVLKSGTIWDPTRYLNIWTVNFGGDSENLLGYAQFPNLSNLPGVSQNSGLASTDGVVIGFRFFGTVGNISPPYDGGRTATHEVGHWLGLRHIWGDGGCEVDDFCEDTPNAGKPNYQCIQASSCGSPNGDMIENYMDYTPDYCMNLFTQDQKMRMRIVLDRSPRRKELINSTVHLGGGNTMAPVATFTANRTNICSGSSVQLNGQSPNSPSSWFWEILDESGTVLGSFTQQNINIRFDFAGIYSIRLTASNSAGTSTKTETNFISVLSSQQFTQLVNQVEEPNQDFQNWLLFNPDNDRSFQIANVSAYGEGNSSILMDNYSTDDDPAGTVDVLITPAIDFSNNDNPYLYFDHAYAQFSDLYSDTLIVFYSTDCGNTFEPVYFRGGKDLATAPTTEDYFVPLDNQWVWNQIFVGYLAGEPSVHFAFANFSGWGNNLYMDNILVFDGSDFTEGGPEAEIYAPVRQICQGEFVAFQDVSSGFPLQWQWNFPGGSPTSSNAQHPFVRYSMPGNYSVNMSCANFFGENTVSQNNYIEVVPLPNLQINASQLPACGGQPIILTASGAQRYEWYDQRSGNLIFEGPSIQVTLFEEWVFEVIGYNSLGCESSESFSVPINAPAKPSITLNGNIISAPFATSYQWYFNGNPISSNQGGNAQNISASFSGTYFVEVFNSSGCSALSDPVQVDLSTSTFEREEFHNSFLVFPNPTHQECYIHGEQINPGEYSLELTDQFGKVIKTEKLTVLDNDFRHIIHLADYVPGVYFLIIRHQDLYSTQRVVKF